MYLYTISVHTLYFQAFFLVDLDMETLRLHRLIRCTIKFYQTALWMPNCIKKLTWEKLFASPEELPCDWLINFCPFVFYFSTSSTDFRWCSFSFNVSGFSQRSSMRRKIINKSFQYNMIFFLKIGSRLIGDFWVCWKLAQSSFYRIEF